MLKLAKSASFGRGAWSKSSKKVSILPLENVRREAKMGIFSCPTPCIVQLCVNGEAGFHGLTEPFASPALLDHLFCNYPPVGCSLPTPLPCLLTLILYIGRVGRVKGRIWLEIRLEKICPTLPHLWPTSELGQIACSTGISFKHNDSYACGKLCIDMRKIKL